MFPETPGIFFLSSLQFFGYAIVPERYQPRGNASITLMRPAALQ
jgi:hypothetical protein